MVVVGQERGDVTSRWWRGRGRVEEVRSGIVFQDIYLTRGVYIHLQSQTISPSHLSI